MLMLSPGTDWSRRTESIRNIQSIRKKNIPLLTWTINSMEKYNLSKKFADNIIFEDIHNEIS